MIRLPPRSPRIDTRCPDTAPFRAGQYRRERRQGRDLQGIAGPQRERARGLFERLAVLALRRLSAAIAQSRRIPARRKAFGCRRARSEEHTSQLQQLMRISYAVFCLTTKIIHQHYPTIMLNNL